MQLEDHSPTLTLDLLPALVSSVASMEKRLGHSTHFQRCSKTSEPGVLREAEFEFADFQVKMPVRVSDRLLAERFALGFTLVLQAQSRWSRLSLLHLRGFLAAVVGPKRDCGLPRRGSFDEGRVNR